MSKIQKEVILEVLKTRELPLEFDLRKICFPEQYKFITDPAPFVTASCSRRAGKTEVCALDLIATAIKNSGINCLYLTLNRGTAERIIWSKLQEFNRKYKLGGEVNLSKLSITFPNKSVIYISGCSDKSELDNYRGMALKLCYIDEVQSFKSYIYGLVDDVIGPSLADYDGKLKLIGTPALICAGFFWDTLQSKEWSHHKWTFWENPHIAFKSKKTHKEVLDKELRRRNVSVNHPSIRREWYGEWQEDKESRVFQYNEWNNYDLLPELTDFVVGVDVGFKDADAIAILGWHKNKRQCYLVEEIVTKEQGVTELATQVLRVIERFNPLKVVMDPGGGGKKIHEEIRKRFQVPICSAEKTRKVEFIELLNDAMRTGKFAARNTSRFAQDSRVVAWDNDKCTPDKKVVCQDPHSDICDAVLYAFRESLHWLSEPEAQLIDMRDRRQWMAHTEKLMAENLEKQIENQKAESIEADFNSMWDQGLQDDPLQYYMNKRKN